MGLDGIGEIGDKASEGQADVVYGINFAARSLTGQGLRLVLARSS